jgi:hypothetical protein
MIIGYDRIRRPDAYSATGHSENRAWLYVDVRIFLGFQHIPHFDRIITKEENEPSVGAKKASRFGTVSTFSVTSSWDSK